MTPYLLGLGPMPPPKPQDVTIAAFYAQMNNPDADVAYSLQNGLCARSNQDSETRTEAAVKHSSKFSLTARAA
jgi:hypothetical protein